MTSTLARTARQSNFGITNQLRVVFLANANMAKERSMAHCVKIAVHENESESWR